MDKGLQRRQKCRFKTYVLLRLVSSATRAQCTPCPTITHPLDAWLKSSQHLQKVPKDREHFRWIFHCSFRCSGKNDGDDNDDLHSLLIKCLCFRLLLGVCVVAASYFCFRRCLRIRKSKYHQQSKYHEFVVINVIVVFIYVVSVVLLTRFYFHILSQTLSDLSPKSFNLNLGFREVKVGCYSSPSRLIPFIEL